MYRGNSPAPGHLVNFSFASLLVFCFIFILVFASNDSFTAGGFPPAPPTFPLRFLLYLPFFFLFPTSFHRPAFFSLVHYFYTHGPSYHSNLINLILFLLSRDHLDLLSFIAFLVPFFRFISGHSSILITHVDDPCQHTVGSLKTNVASVLHTD